MALAVVVKKLDDSREMNIGERKQSGIIWFDSSFIWPLLCALEL